jgi:hypothetical protein
MFKSIVASSSLIVGLARGGRLCLRLAVISHRGLFVGPLRLFGGPFGASTFTPLLILRRRRHGGRDDRRPVEGDVWILGFEAASSLLVEGWSPYPDAWWRPIPVQNPLARRLTAPGLNMNEIGAFVTAFISRKSEKGHDLLAFW